MLAHCRFRLGPSFGSKPCQDRHDRSIRPCTHSQGGGGHCRYTRIAESKEGCQDESRRLPGLHRPRISPRSGNARDFEPNSFRICGRGWRSASRVAICCRHVGTWMYSLRPAQWKVALYGFFRATIADEDRQSTVAASTEAASPSREARNHVNEHTHITSQQIESSPLCGPFYIGRTSRCS